MFRKRSSSMRYLWWLDHQHHESSVTEPPTSVAMWHLWSPDCRHQLPMWCLQPSNYRHWTTSTGHRSVVSRHWTANANLEVESSNTELMALVAKAKFSVTNCQREPLATGHLICVSNHQTSDLAATWEKESHCVFLENTLLNFQR